MLPGTPRGLALVFGTLILVGCESSGGRHQQTAIPRPVETIQPPSSAPLVAPPASSTIPAPPPPEPVAPVTPTVKPVALALPPAQSVQQDPPPETAKPTSVKLPSSENATNIVGLESLRQLRQQSEVRAAQMDSYTARLRLREQVKGKDTPEELIRFQFRQEPFSVHMKWLGTVGQGREVIFVRGRYEDKIHTLVARSDNLLFAGKHMAFAPDDPLVRDSTRHSITEAGLGNLVLKFGRLLDANEHGDHRFGTISYLGTQQRPEFSTPLDAVEQIIPPNAERWLARGGRRVWFFDPKEHLPVLVVAFDDTNHEVEYYCYDYILWPVKLDEDDFNPAKFDAKKK